ncbi:MAG: sugar ABC transporter substrate-binding protein, partial [Ruminococcus sp.]|nr:sugar ABC transporter substrate-binding protein [Ruminococcus sp.]
ELPAECTYIPFGLTIDGKIEERYADRTAFNDSTGVGISISCSDPDGAVKFLSQLIEPEILNLRFWGVEGVDYTVDENGVFDQTEEQYERWREKSYLKKHVCNYSYMPYFVGMAHDGINAYTSSNQPNIFYDHLNDTIKECFDAYGVRTYTEKLNPAPENPKWYPMWSFSNAVTDETDYGKVMKQLDAVKHKYMPLMVMSDDFEKTWKEYTTEYNKADPQVYFDELTAEVHRRCDK